jgi:hypothetical protein
MCCKESDCGLGMDLLLPLLSYDMKELVGGLFAALLFGKSFGGIFLDCFLKLLIDKPPCRVERNVIE